MELRGRNIGMIRRIAAILVALAALAEHAGGRSFPVRWFLLCVLRQAESVACAYVADTTRTDWPPLEEHMQAEHRPLDAALLAWRFRALAAVLTAALRLACLGACLPLDGAPARSARLPRPRGLAAAAGRLAPPPDTS